MFAFNEKEFSDVKKLMCGYKTLGIVSCGGCPAMQKKGGKVGIERWGINLKEEFDIKWAFVASTFCDERMLKINIKELGEKLEEVDAVVVMTCKAGEEVIERVLGFDCISCLETLYFGIMKENGTIEKYGNIRIDGVEA